MAGLVFGDISGAIVSGLRKLISEITIALKWIKQAILKAFHYISQGIKESVRYEKALTTTLLNNLSRDERTRNGVMFALLFDFLNINGVY